MRDDLENVVRRFIPNATISGLRKLTGGASQQTWSFDAKSANGVEPLILRQAQTWASPQQESLPLSLEASLIQRVGEAGVDRKSTRLNSSHVAISYAVFCLK